MVPVLVLVFWGCLYHHFEFDYILNLYVLSMCFVCYRSWIVCTVCNAALMRVLAFPLRPRYIRCSTVITPDIVEFDWFKTTHLLPKSAAVIKVIPVDWAEVILLWPFLVKFPILTQTSMLSHHGQLGVAFAFLPPLFLVLLHSYKPYGMQFDVWGAG